jgi:hypothetical protein
MATLRVDHSKEGVPAGKSLISCEQAIETLSPDERFFADCLCHEYFARAKGSLFTVGIEFQFRQWAQKHHKSG